MVRSDDMNPQEIEARFPEIWRRVSESYERQDHAIDTIKMIRGVTGLNLGNAKRIYVAVTENMTLEDYQEQIWRQLLPALEEMEDVTILDDGIEIDLTHDDES